MGWLSGIFAWLANLFSGGSLSKFIVAVQAFTVERCRFLPMAESVAALVRVNPASTAAVDGAMMIARKICAAVTQPAIATPSLAAASAPLSLMGGEKPPVTVIVDGVVVQGTFVEKPKEK